MIDLRGREWDRMASADPKAWDRLCEMIDQAEAEVARLKVYLKVSGQSLAQIGEALAAEREKVDAMDEALHSNCTLTEDHPTVRLLQAERERSERLASAITAWRHTHSLPDCPACAVLDAHPGSALAPAQPEGPVYRKGKTYTRPVFHAEPEDGPNGAALLDVWGTAPAQPEEKP